MTHRPTLADWIDLMPHLIDSNQPVAVTTTELNSLLEETGFTRNDPNHIFGCRIVEVPDSELT
jgi:hypothetical protein